jgi:Fe-S oxidoreductase
MALKDEIVDHLVGIVGEKESSTRTMCGYCKGVCPGIQCAEGWASLGPRGKVALSYGVVTGEIPLDQSVADRLFQCVLCGDCFLRCPSGIRAPELVKAASGVKDRKIAVKELSDLVWDALK